VDISQPRGQQGRQYDQAELESRLRDALAELTSQGASFRELSVSQLLDLAGVARSTFYSYYEDKVAMLLVLAEASLRRVYEAPAQWIRRGADATRDDIAAAMRLLLDVFLADAAVLRAVAETAAYDRRVRAAYQGAVQDYAQAMARAIRAGQSDRRMRSVDAATTAEALAWMVERTVSLIAAETSPASLDSIAEALTDVTYRTLFD
jgi:AcrR family transcriptional regulator